MIIIICCCFVTSGTCCMEGLSGLLADFRKKHYKPSLMHNQALNAEDTLSMISAEHMCFCNAINCLNLKKMQLVIFFKVINNLALKRFTKTRFNKLFPQFRWHSTKTLRDFSIDVC